MTRAYYSTVLDHSADQVWSKIQDFNDDRWSGVVTKSYSENNQSGSTVGTIRYHEFDGKVARSDLRAYSSVGRFLTYGFVGTPPVSVDNYEATLRVLPVVDGNRAFVEWQATFDCPEPDRKHWMERLGGSFANWLDSLRESLA